MRGLRTLTGGLWGGLLLVACGGGGGDEPPAPPGDTPSAVVTADTSCALPDFQAEVMRQVNAARAMARSCGSTAMPAVDPLVWSNPLFTAAARHSLDMASHNHFDHTGTDNSSSAQRVSDAGYAWAATGENIAAGYGSVSSVMAGWLASEGHCRNLMSATFRDVAVSCVQRSGTTYGSYWTMLLARPR